MKRFEELVAWQLARALTREVYIVSREGAFGSDFGLARQMQRAAVSVMANVAEGFERNRVSEFHQFLSVAKASCAELRSHLYVARDVGYLAEERFGELMEQADEVARVIGGLRASIERKRDASGP